MSLRFEGGKTWPYPVRSVELVDGWKREDFDIGLLELGEDEIEILKRLDEGLFEEIKKIKEKKVEKLDGVEGEVEQRRMLVREEYWGRKGNIESFSEIVRIGYGSSDDDVEAKKREYKDLKLRIKGMLREIGSDDDLSRASSNVLDMYRKYINVRLAELNYLVVEIARNEERMDKFIRGVFYEKDAKGNFVTLGDNLRKEVELLEGEESESLNYAEVWLDENDIELVANFLLKKLGVEEWRVVKRKSGKSTFGVYKPKKEIRIGKNMKRRVEEVLPVIAHEIEGHVLHGDTDLSTGYLPKIMKYYSAGGRDSILGEMMGRWVEDETRVLMGLKPKKPETLYFRTLERKRDGSNFVECFDFYFREYAKRQKLSLNEIFDDRQEYEVVFDHTYDRVMRLFRKGSPLNSKDGFLLTTDQLKYLEQYLVLKKLDQLGMKGLMFLDGADLYSVKQIVEMGLLTGVDNIRPKFVLANEIWPVIKVGLDEGKSIKTILNEMR